MQGVPFEDGAAMPYLDLKIVYVQYLLIYLLNNFFFITYIILYTKINGYKQQQKF